MPYRSRRELPANLRKILSPHAQEIYRKAFNNALKQYGNEKTAHKVAWNAVKMKYKKDKDGKWVRKMSDSYFIPFAERDDGYYLFFPLGTTWHRRRKIEFTADDAEEMVANFKQHDVPGYDLPINILHKDEYGVFGVIEDLRLADGEVQWKPEWRPGKMEEVKSKGYRYASPEVWFEEYQSRDGTIYDNVAMGIAITPRPRLGRATAVFSDDTGEWEFGHIDEKGNYTPDVEDYLYELERVNSMLQLLRSFERVKSLATDARNAIRALQRIAHALIDAFEEDTILEEFIDADFQGGCPWCGYGLRPEAEACSFCGNTPQRD